MRPAFVYSGGKSRELKRILPVVPDNHRIVEPFAGGAAVSFKIEKPGTVLSDLRHNVINCYQQLADPEVFPKILKQINEWKTWEHDDLEKKYYELRDEGYGNEDPLFKALRWIFIRQTTFSGIDRINTNTGKINSPYGHKMFTSNINEDHHEFLKSCDIRLCSYEDTIADTNSNDWIFLDPPYLNRNSTYGDDGYEDDVAFHTGIRDSLLKTDAKWMMIHVDCPEYRELYKDFNIKDKDFKYTVNYRDRDNSKQKVKHLYITNY